MATGLARAYQMKLVAVRLLDLDIRMQEWPLLPRMFFDLVVVWGLWVQTQKPPNKQTHSPKQTQNH